MNNIYARFVLIIHHYRIKYCILVLTVEENLYELLRNLITMQKKQYPPSFFLLHTHDSELYILKY
jgi:hypothetical protein